MKPDEPGDLEIQSPLTHPCIISPEECQSLIDLSESLGFQPARIEGAWNGPRGFVVRNGRDNSRVAIDDCKLADALWQRVARMVPETINQNSVVGLNQRLRFYRYQPGQSFGLHRDGFYQRSQSERSRLTLILYLNDEYSGGETFFADSESLIAPRAGKAILFPHQLWHEGRTVKDGHKYILRTDVMYK
jgi:predicted 2-oxoglutarate/Fe(II)-dependent dioxygenase YbiX